MTAKKRAVKAATPFRRDGTGRLEAYGEPGTFGLALAKKLATAGLTEAEYILIAQEFGTSVKRFKAYIKYFKDAGFNIVLENGSYVEKKEASNTAGSSILTQEASNGYLPAKEDSESAYRTLTRFGENISIDAVLDQMEINANKKGLSLKCNWRIITEKNIEIWSKKK